jgi:hypothetical protein
MNDHTMSQSSSSIDQVHPATRMGAAPADTAAIPMDAGRSHKLIVQQADALALVKRESEAS